MSGSPLVYVVVLNWNGWEDTEQCLESLRDLDYERVRVLVVDNASTDDSVLRLRERLPEQEVLETGSNLGYAGGNNVGIRHAIAAGADFVWVLNNDTRVAPDALSVLLEGVREFDRLGIVASQNARPEGWNYRVGFTRGANGLVEIECDGCSDARPYHWAKLVQGASVLISARALEDVGLFDEDYFHYYEDRDLAERMVRRGWRLAFACRANVVHASGKSLLAGTPQAQYYQLRNHLLYRRKLYSESALHVLVREPRLLRNALSMRRALQLNLGPTVAGVTALADGWRGRGGKRDLA